MVMTFCLFVMGILNYILQTSVLPIIAIGGIKPNLLLLFVVICGLLAGQKVGLLTGFWCGFLTDLFGSQVLGGYALLFMLMGYLAGFFHHSFYKEDIKLPMLLIGGADLIFGFIVYFILFLFRGRFDIGYYMIRVIVPEAVYTVILGLLLYPLYYLMFRLLNRLSE